MRSILARPASITWLAAAAALAALAAPGCRFSAPQAAGDDDGGDDAPVIDAAPDAPADAAPDAAYVPACMTDPTYSNNGGHRYKLQAQGADYDTAIDRCAAEGAHPIVVDSVEESDYLRTLVGSDVWIGLDDLTIEDQFRWVTGATSTYRRWAPGEPTNSNFGEDCVYARSDKQWNDTSCGDGKQVVCECDPAYRPPPTPMCRKATSGYETRRGRRYFVHSTPRTWQDAEADCQSIEAHLVTIDDIDENDDMAARFIITSAWLGYTDAVAEGQFKWTDDSPSTYQRFGGSAPSNEDEDCAVLLDLGGWDDRACTETHPYACECAP
jgi:hypothetical protein